MSQQLTITADGKPCYDILLRNDWAELAVAFVQGQIMDEKYKKNRINNR